MAFVCIEFKEEDIKIACLRNSFSGLDLLSSFTFPFRDDDDAIADINSFIARHIKGTKNVFVSIPHRWAIIKFIKVPLPEIKGRNTLPQMMRFEIERHIPYQIEDVYYDFQVVGKEGTTYTIIFAVIHKEKIDYVKNFLGKMSLQSQIITLSNLARMNSIGFSEVLAGGWQNFLGITKKPNICARRNESCISLFIDSDETHLALLKDGSFIDIRSFALNLDNPLDVIVDDISSKLTAIISEIPKMEINRFILSGTATSLSEIAPALGARFAKDVQIIKPFSRFFRGKSSVKMEEVVGPLGSCYSGLGMQVLGINLLPHTTDTRTRKIAHLVTKISIPVILFLTVGIFAGELVNNKRLLAKIEGKLKENEPEIKVIEKVIKDSDNLKQQRDFLIRIKENDVLLEVLAELASILPSDSWLTNLDYKKIYDEKVKTTRSEMVISGYAVSSSTLISVLENSPFFEKVEFVGPITRKGDKEGFKIKAVTVKPVKSSEEPASQIGKREKTIKEAKEKR